jgi:hypothetical protein
MSRKNRAKTSSTSSSTSAKAPYKAKDKKPVKVKKERGAVLTVLLLLILVWSAFTTWVAYTNLKADYGPKQQWVLPVLFLVSVADIVAAFAMLYWKKWGIYLYAISRVVAAAVHLLLTGSLLIVFADLLPVSILAYVIQLQRKDKLFE